MEHAIAHLRQEPVLQFRVRRVLLGIGVKMRPRDVQASLSRILRIELRIRSEGVQSSIFSADHQRLIGFWAKAAVFRPREAWKDTA